MDSLALLCTLHADGPATLRRLRTSGCDSLRSLEALPAEQLSELLRVTPAVARRLGREARILRLRVDEDPLEREESPEGLTRGSLLDGTPEGALTEGPLDKGDYELLGRVLDTWAEPVSQAEPEPEVEPKVEPEAASGAPAQPEESTQQVSAPAPEQVPEAGEPQAVEVAPQESESVSKPAPFTSLADALTVDLVSLPVGAVDGLDAELAADLARAGIVDLVGLGQADCDELAHLTGRSFSQLRRVQFLARRQTPGAAQRLKPRAPFGAGVPIPSAPTEATSAPEQSVEPSQDSDSPPFGANIVLPVAGPVAGEVSAKKEPTPNSIPTRQRTEAPGMEHPVPAPPAPSPRRFWEPRSLYEARTSRASQAESIESSEASLPPAPAQSLAKQEFERSEPVPQSEVRPINEPVAAPSEKVPPTVPDRNLVLQWNFEIPAPGTAPETIFPATEGRAMASGEGESERGDAAGPFA